MEKFIKRKEFDEIKNYVSDENIANGDLNCKVIFISGEGGMGKSRLLLELKKSLLKENEDVGQEEKPSYFFFPTIDFDSRKYYSIEDVDDLILDNLPHDSLYDKLEKELHEFIEKKINPETIEAKREELKESFKKIYNRKFSTKTKVLIFDTVEKLDFYEGEGEKIDLKLQREILSDLIDKIPILQNSYMILSGRPKVVGYLKDEFSKNKISSKLISIGPFDESSSLEYIESKQEEHQQTIGRKTIIKLCALSYGKPLLLDLAVDWYVKELDMKWLNSFKIKTDETVNTENEKNGAIVDIEKNINEIKAYKSEITESIRNDFEEILVSKIKELETPIDDALIALAHVYPVDAEVLHILFPEPDSINLEELKQLTTIKVLPDGSLKLHDEIHRLINKYVYPAIGDEIERRKLYSQKIIDYYKNKYLNLLKEYEKEIVEDINVTKKLINNLFEYLKKYIVHLIYSDTNKFFKKLNDIKNILTTINFGKFKVFDLLSGFDKLPKEFSINENIDYKIVTTEIYKHYEDYERIALILDSKIENRANDLQKIEIKLLKSDAFVKQGDYAKSITELETAKEINKTIDKKIKKKAINEIKIDKELGWNYRLKGDYENALKYYENVRNRIEELTQMQWAENEDLAIEYGWNLNNMAFVLSNSNPTRKTSIEVANLAIDHWKKASFEKGEAAGYSTGGIVNYRIDNFDKAREHFDLALEIFKDLQLDDSIKTIYSWRGALYQDLNEKEFADKAMKELLRALGLHDEYDVKDFQKDEKKFKSIVPMSYNRLGRVFMTKRDWEKAEICLNNALKSAKALPDYIYWLGTIGRLAYLAASYTNSNWTLDKLEKEYEEFIKKIKAENIEPEKNSLGITQMAFAQLQLKISRNQDQKINDEVFGKIISWLKEAIPHITEYGSYGRSDIKSRLAHFQKELRSCETEIIVKIGNNLWDKFKNEKKIEYQYAKEIVANWKNWKTDE